MVSRLIRACAVSGTPSGRVAQVVLSTWPEHHVAIVDLVVCGDHEAAHAAWQALQQHLRPMMVELSAQTISLE